MKTYKITLTEREINLISFALGNMAIDVSNDTDSQINLSTDGEEWVNGCGIHDLALDLQSDIDLQRGIINDAFKRIGDVDNTPNLINI